MLTAKVIDFGAYRASRDGSEIISSADNDDVVTGDDIGELSLVLPEDARDVHGVSSGCSNASAVVFNCNCAICVVARALAAFAIWMPLRDGAGIGGHDLETVSVDNRRLGRA